MYLNLIISTPNLHLIVLKVNHLPFLPTAWAKALAATDLAAFDELGLDNTFAAFDATDLLVALFSLALPIFSPPFFKEI
jgi:hypothetical protein